MSAESLKNTWESIFRRKGGDGVCTRLVDSMDPGQRDTLLRAIELRAAELPVIGSLQGPNNWLLLTTERLVWTVVGERHEIDVKTIRHVRPDLSKPEMRALQVTTLEGDEYKIELEPGRPLNSTWHVLNNLVARNRRTSRHT
jgi:hypothetical protein